MWLLNSLQPAGVWNLKKPMQLRVPNDTIKYPLLNLVPAADAHSARPSMNPMNLVFLSDVPNSD